MEAYIPDRVMRRFLSFFAALCVLLIAFVGAEEAWSGNDDLFSIDFPTEREGWACGRYGRILHTSDGGATWRPQSSGTTFTLSGISFSDTQTGWAVGNKGTILHTKDGGRTWTLQESPVDYFHMDVLSMSPQRCLIVSERTHILATDDEGATWRVQFEDQDYILKSISFCDDEHGWAVGEFGHTYHTNDGGQTWEKQAGRYEMDWDTGFITGDNFLFDVVALNPNEAWAVGILGTALHTTDGGATWEKVDTGAPKVQLFTIASNGQGVLVIGGKGVCRSSEDGGRTWGNARFRPTIQYGWIYDVEFLENGQGIACGDEGAVYRKPSSGGHWTGIEY
jgi:photosystem II stability/assembly factor-like uncharacterized protein